MVQGVPRCRPLLRVLLQHLEEQTLSIFADLNYILFLGGEVAALVVSEDFISRVSTEQITTSQQIEED